MFNDEELNSAEIIALAKTTIAFQKVHTAHIHEAQYVDPPEDAYEEAKKNTYLVRKALVEEKNQDPHTVTLPEPKLLIISTSTEVKDAIEPLITQAEQKGVQIRDLNPALYFNHSAEFKDAITPLIRAHALKH